MSLLRKRSGSNKVSKEKPTQEGILLSPSSGMKTSAVSRIVKQLQDQGYQGDLLRNASMSYDVQNPASEGLAEELESIDEVDSNLFVDDIDFDESEKLQKIKTKLDKNIPTERDLRSKKQKMIEERTANSQQQIENINSSAKNLYKNIDLFINDLRMSANNARDNKRLCLKLENIRKMCVAFTRGIQNQLPRYATSLFVSMEEEK